MKAIALTSIAILTALAGGGTALYYYRVGVAVPPASGATVRDRSESVLSGCDCTTALARRALRERSVGKGSTLTMITTGDRLTADEPVLIARYDVPSTRQSIEGRAATLRKQEALLADLQGKCEKLAVTNRSPILLAIRRAIEGLMAAGCNRSFGCFVYVQSDGEETAEPKVRQLLTSKSKDNKTSTSPLIDNDGIDIIFYGLSETVGERETADGLRRHFTRERDAAHAEQLQTVWRSLFTHPERVRFEPFCPISSVALR
jgi:hypothetical protein